MSLEDRITERFDRILPRLKVMKAILEEYEEKPLSLRDQLTLERAVEILADTIIDIALWIAKYHSSERPRTNREVVMLLATIGVLDKDFASRLASLAGLRNILAHQYVGIEADSLHQHAKQLLEDFPRFQKEIYGYIKKIS
jgi:uncharacterized protein YutE (UPF0331/DUF86 family)